MEKQLKRSEFPISNKVKSNDIKANIDKTGFNRADMQESWEKSQKTGENDALCSLMVQRRCLG